ncbi:MAG: glycosyltransferase [Terracidiphilus sp.]|jgi:colanic acid/amylovoran biosynthesis glycosyltransferase
MLAVFTPELGASFINRHIDDLLPGRTVAVARCAIPTPPNAWQQSCPVFFLDQWALSLFVRAARRAGASDNGLRAAALKRFLRQHGVTVVLGEFLEQFVDFVPLLDRMGLPYVVQGHGMDLNTGLPKPGMADRYLAYNSARAILTRCEFHRQRLINIGLPPAKIHVNFGGVDVPAQPPRRGPGASKRFLAVSYFTPKKGPIHLLESFRRAAARDREITLDIVGGGPLLPAVHQFVHACGLADRVRLHGAASEDTKRRLLLECGIFVQHSITDPETGDEEGLPAAIQEAMAQGMAVVSTRHAGIPEAVVEGETGLLVEEGNTEEMAGALLEAISNASVLGKAGYLRAASTHNWLCEKSRLIRWLGVSQATARSNVSSAYRVWLSTPRPIRLAAKAAVGAVLSQRQLQKIAPHTPSADEFMGAGPDNAPAVAQSLALASSHDLPGDYYEFGLWRGYSFWHAQQAARELGLSRMHFWGFDSFAGVPDAEGTEAPPPGHDATRGGVKKGAFSCSKDQVIANLTKYGVDWSRTTLIEGWYDQSLTPELKQSLGLKPLAVALIDCDLYASTVPVLAFLADLLQEGSILLFDDWNLFDASDAMGERKAFLEFREAHPNWEAETYINFGWHGQAFIMHRR